MIKILTTPDEISPHLKKVRELADSRKQELGFIPYAVYEDSMHKGNLFVATVDNSGTFAGFVLLGGRFPVRRIFQLAVSDPYRGQGVGKELVDATVQHTVERGFNDIVIKVGEKLPANAFWEKQGFAFLHTIKGGQLHPFVNIRIREIRPSLFSAAAQLQSPLQAAADSIAASPTLYFLDTNILLDISKNRPNSDASQNLLCLASKGDIEVAIAEESIKELEKNPRKGDDPALNIANSLPIFSTTNDKDLISSVKNIVFPSSRGNIRTRDEADIRHIATAISNSAKGFITRDKSILRAERILWNKFDIQILSPADFWEDDDEEGRLDGIRLDRVEKQERLKISTDLTDKARGKIKKLAPNHKIDESKFDYATLELDGTIVALCALEKRKPQGGRARDAILVVPGNSGKRNASVMLDYISHEAKPYANITSAINLRLWGKPREMADVLVERGYHKTEDNAYKKICVGPVINVQNWEEQKDIIKKISSISLPDELPIYQSFKQKVSLGQTSNVPLDVLENFLSTILILPDRDGAIIPIKEQYADDFWGHLPQKSFLDPPPARLNVQKSYFGTHRVASRLQPGKLLFFYQSKTRVGSGKEVIAFARIVRSNIASKDQTKKESRGQGVVDDTAFAQLTKSPTLLETVFTHSVVFPKPVPLEKLREIGCGDPANFVTAFKITHEQVCTLLKEGGIL